MSSAGETETVSVRFKTKDERYVVAETPFQIPKNLNRRGLSQVLNHLLGLEKPIPFDFLLENEYLRTTLEKHIQSYVKNEEPVLTVWYMEALTSSAQAKSHSHPDWVSSVITKQPQKGSESSPGGTIWSGCYDGLCRLWSDQDMVLEIKPPDTTKISPIFSLGVFSEEFSKKNKVAVVAGFRNSDIVAYSASGDCVRILKGHKGAVYDISISPSTSMVCSASWDKSIKLWEVGSKSYSSSNSEGSKRMKIEQKQEKFIGPEATLIGHTQCVTSVCWKSEEQLVSGSWDQSIRFWDIESGTNSSTKNATQTVTDIDQNSLGLVLSTHPDDAIRLWDSRTSESSIFRTFSSHKGWVSCVSFHPVNPQLFASGSYDKTIKIWDLRSKLPLMTIDEAHKDKVLCLKWCGSESIVSGGADGEIKFTTVKQ